jgi:hypothetical protein
VAILALILTVVWLAVVIGLRTYIAYRRTGTVVTLSPALAGTAAWWAK